MVTVSRRTNILTLAIATVAITLLATPTLGAPPAHAGDVSAPILVRASLDDTTVHLVAQNLTTGTTTPITGVPASPTYPAASLDGSLLGYVRVDVDDPTTLSVVIVVDGQVRREIAIRGPEVPALSAEPDGAGLLIATPRRIVRYAVARDSLGPVCPACPTLWYRAARLSPDGTLIALRHEPELGVSVIEIRRVSDGELVATRTVAAGFITARDVEWSPSGRRIAYTRDVKAPEGVASVIETLGIDGRARRTAFNDARSLREPYRHYSHPIWINGRFWALRQTVGDTVTVRAVSARTVHDRPIPLPGVIWRGPVDIEWVLVTESTWTTRTPD